MEFYYQIYVGTLALSPSLEFSPCLFTSHVLFPPGAPKIVSVAKQYAKFGDLGMVECSIDSVPDPTSIVWTRDGEPLEWASLDRFVKCDL